MESKKCNGSPYAWKGQDNYLSAAINDGCGQIILLSAAVIDGCEQNDA